MAESLTSRPLGRTGRSISPVIWELSYASDAMPTVAWAYPDDAADSRERERAGAQSADVPWLLLPASTQPATSDPEPATPLILGARAADIESRRSTFIQDRLAQLGRARCDAVLLQDASIGQVKAGGPFHRLSRLRDQGLLDLFFIEAADHEQAEWLLENSPAHALSIPFDLHDLTPAYRLLDSAAELGTAILARPTARPAWPGASAASATDHLGYILGEQRISAAITPAGVLPPPPMPDDPRQTWWDRFRATVPEPPKPKRGTPMDMA